MSTLKKERIIYIAGIALFALTVIALSFPFITVGIYTDAQSVQLAESVTYLGWQIFKIINPLRTELHDPTDESTKYNPTISPRGSEAGFVIFTALLLIFSLFVAAICGIGLFRNLKNGTGVGKKWINMLFILYFAFAAIMLILYIIHITYLNTATIAAADAKSWSGFAFKNLSGIETKMGITPFAFVVLGAGAMFTSVVCTMGIQDNSILYPYKRRQVYSSLLTIALCIGVFFLPFIDYFFSTDFLSYSDNATTISGILYTQDGTTDELALMGLENISKYFTNGVGWDMILTSSGNIQGYYKVLFVVMFVVAGCGILYAVANLLGACEVIRFNFNKKYLNTICFTIMVIGILLWVGSLAFMIGVNTRMEGVFGGTPELFSIAYPDGEFPQTECTLGAWLSMVPGIVGFAGVAALNAFDD